MQAQHLRQLMDGEMLGALPMLFATVAKPTIVSLEGLFLGEKGEAVVEACDVRLVVGDGLVDFQREVHEALGGAGDHVAVGALHIAAQHPIEAVTDNTGLVELQG